MNNPLQVRFQSGNVDWYTRSDGKTKSRFSWESSANLPSDFTIKVTIRSEDYGAYGIFKARLYKKRLSIIRYIDESATFGIPKDDNSNNIADAWEVPANGWIGSVTSEDDLENAGHTLHGDGFVEDIEAMKQSNQTGESQ